MLALFHASAKRDLRRSALGRKYSLFVGHDDGGEILAVVQRLVTTCAQNGIHPEPYLADVLIRVPTWSNARTRELLPDQWTPPASAWRGATG